MIADCLLLGYDPQGSGIRRATAVDENCSNTKSATIYFATGSAPVNKASGQLLQRLLLPQ
jgi:hypothetical protein